LKILYDERQMENVERERERERREREEQRTEPAAHVLN
jgi:hypothetical protein